MTDLDQATLLELWRRMVRIRRFEERVHEETAAKRTEGYTHTAYGEEATAVGAISLLRDDDWLTTTYRNHHHAHRYRDRARDRIGEVAGGVDADKHRHERDAAADELAYRPGGEVQDRPGRQPSEFPARVRGIVHSLCRADVNA